MTSDQAIDSFFVIACLEDAMDTARAVRSCGYTTNLTQAVRDIVQDNEANKYAGSARMRPPIPSSAKIDAMDEVLSWLAIIPDSQRVVRRIVGMRAMLKLDGDAPSWRGIARVVNADRRAVERWHGKGISKIANELNRRAGNG